MIGGAAAPAIIVGIVAEVPAAGALVPALPVPALPVPALANSLGLAPVPPVAGFEGAAVPAVSVRTEGGGVAPVPVSVLLTAVPLPATADVVLAGFVVMPDGTDPPEATEGPGLLLEQPIAALSVKPAATSQLLDIRRLKGLISTSSSKRALPNSSRPQCSARYSTDLNATRCTEVRLDQAVAESDATGWRCSRQRR